MLQQDSFWSVSDRGRIISVDAQPERWKEKNSRRAGPVSGREEKGEGLWLSSGGGTIFCDGCVLSVSGLSFTVTVEAFYRINELFPPRR